MRPEADRFNIEMLRTFTVVGALACIAVASMGVWHMSAAQAKESRGKTTVKVMVSNSERPASDDADYERTKTEELTKIAVERVRTRLETARIKQYSVETDAPGTIVVTARGGVSHALLAGIMVPQGRFELRPSEPVGSQWMKRASRLPEGVEIRQEKASFAVDDAYLWSRSKSKLQKVIADTTLADVDVFLYPMGKGWRTLALAAPVATHDDVAKASIRKGKTGDVYVQVSFNQEISARHITPNERRTWAAVLDSEVVATFERMDADFGDSLTMTSPDHLGTKKLRRMWAQQVAGRLAAHMTVPLVELPDGAN